MSTLNAEAPEFVPTEVMSHTQKGFVTMNKTIRLSNNLPVGAAYKQCRSVANFDVVTEKFRDNVIFQLNSIFMTELPSFRLKEDDFEYNMERIIDANDSILDRIYNNIDCVKKGVEPNRHDDSKVIGPGGYYKPKITTIQLGRALFMAASNITRPQLLFKDKIDNSHDIWKPKLTTKPHNIMPLALRILYDDYDKPIGYEHPYALELSKFQPRDEWLLPDHEEPAIPPPLEETTITLISTEEELDDLIKHLYTVEMLGVDLEHHSYRTYQGFTCLIQITTVKGDFIIDALACREYLQKLNEIFTDPKILKIFHGANMDVQWLQRDFGVYIVGLFDTCQAAVVLQQGGKSLAALLKRYCGLDVNKTIRLADWRIRPLTKDLINYARTDTHYLAYLFRRMRADLLAAAHGDRRLLLEAFERSRKVCGLTYNKPIIREDSHMSLYHKNMKNFNAQQMAALSVLFRWRDREARTLDESAIYLLPNHMLMQLAEYLPRDTQGIVSICTPMPPFIKQNIDTIHRMILSCRELQMDREINMSAFASACLQPPAPDYEVHDVPQEEGEEESQEAPTETGFNDRLHGLSLHTEVRMGLYFTTKPDIMLFVMDDDIKNEVDNATHNIQPFLPPHDRFLKYRSLAQIEELRMIQEKEAKINAIARGNQIIKEELLDKLEEVKAQVQKEKAETETKSIMEPVPSTSHALTVTETEKRKKKKKWQKKKSGADGQTDNTTKSDSSQSGTTTAKSTTREHQPYSYSKTKYYYKFRDNS